MSDHSYELLGPLMTDLGHAVASQLGELPKRAYVFVIAERGTAQVALYVEHDDVVSSLIPADDLFEIAMKIWQIDNAKRAEALRWIYFEYDIQDGRFDAHFYYPEEIAPGTDSDDWQTAGEKKRFGDKHILQPEIPTMESPPGR